MLGMQRKLLAANLTDKPLFPGLISAVFINGFGVAKAALDI